MLQVGLAIFEPHKVCADRWPHRKGLVVQGVTIDTAARVGEALALFAKQHTTGAKDCNRHQLVCWAKYSWLCRTRHVVPVWGPFGAVFVSGGSSATCGQCTRGQGLHYHCLHLFSRRHSWDDARLDLQNKNRYVLQNASCRV